MKSPIGTDHPSRLLRLGLLALAVACFAAPAQAQIQVQPQVPAPGDEDLEPEVDDQQVQAEMFTGWTDETFDQWVFGQRTPNASRTRLLSLLMLQIEDVDRICGLSDAQKAKLELAGKGDVKHLYDRVAEKKRKFQLVKNDRNKIGNIFQEIQPLQSAFNSGPFDDSSIFFKSIKGTLDDAQAAKYEKNQSDKRLFRYRAKVDLTVAFLDNAVGFKADQRKKLADLLVAETKPPKRYGQYDYYVVMWQAAKLPEDKIKPIFDDTQWKLLTRQLTQVQGMGQFLKQNGYLDEGDELPKPVDPRVDAEAKAKALHDAAKKADVEKKAEAKKDADEKKADEKKAEPKKIID